jgi:hypothetical protein
MTQQGTLVIKTTLFKIQLRSLLSSSSTQLSQRTYAVLTITQLIMELRVCQWTAQCLLIALMQQDLQSQFRLPTQQRKEHTQFELKDGWGTTKTSPIRPSSL